MSLPLSLVVLETLKEIDTTASGNDPIKRSVWVVSGLNKGGEGDLTKLMDKIEVPLPMNQGIIGSETNQIHDILIGNSCGYYLNSEDTITYRVVGETMTACERRRIYILR